MASGTFYPGVDADDGWWEAATALDATSIMYLGNGANDLFNGFIRFINVTIPQGSTINTAYVKLKSDQNLSGTDCNLNIYFNNIDNAIAPATFGEADALALTGAVAWNAVGAWTAGTQYNTPELKTILQTVVDRGSFASGNAVMALIKENASTYNAYRAARTIGMDPIEKIELYVEWIPAIDVAGSLTFPILQVSGTMINPVRDVASSISLPLLQIAGEMTNPSRWISGSLFLPSLSIALAGTVPGHNIITGSVSLPLLSVVAALSPMTYVTADLDKSIGPVSVVAEGGGYIDTEIPAIAISATATNHPVARLSKSIPAITLSATALQEQIASLDKTIPGITISASGRSDYHASLSRSIPAIVLTASAIQSHIATLAKSIGAISLSASAYLMGTNSANLIIPAITLSARAQGVLAEIIALALNTKNFGLSKYTSYNYNSLCIFNGEVIGGKSNGIYELSGTTDNDGTAISWKMKTGELLLHKNKLREVWLSGKMSGDLKMTVETAEGESYEYDVDSVSTNEDSVRIKVGKGLDSEYVTIEFTNVSGETVEIDKIQGFGMKL